MKTIGKLLICIVMVACVFGFLVNVLPASPESLKELSNMTENSPEAKENLIKLLKETPNPSLWQLAKMRVRVKEVIVTEIAREITGEQSLKTPSERHAATASAMKSSSNELEERLASHWSEFVAVLLFTMVIVLLLLLFIALLLSLLLLLLRAKDWYYNAKNGYRGL